MELITQAHPDAPTDAPIYSLTVEQAADLYEQAGVSRTIRRIQKYCARKDLDCDKLETETGKQYFISKTSVERHIAQITEALTAVGRAPTRPDASERSLETKNISKQEEDASHSAQLRPDAPEHPLQTKEIPQEEPVVPVSAQARPDAAGRNFQDLYIQQLETENAFLRDQTVVLLERVKETNVLTQGLQRLLSPLLRSPETSEDDKSTTN